MRLFFGSWQRKFLTLLVLSLSLGFVYQNPSILSYDTFKNTLGRQLSNAQEQLGLKTSSMTTVYSRRDENGSVEFSDNAPLNDANATSIIIDSNVNLIPAIPQNTKAPAVKQNSAGDNLAEITPTTPYTEPQKIIKLLNDANNIQDVLNNRKTNLDRQLDEM